MNPKPTLALAAALLLALTACANPDPAPPPSPSPAATDPAADCIATVGAWADEIMFQANATATPGAAMPEIADLPETYQPVADAMAGDVALAAANPGTAYGDEAYDRAVDTLVQQCDRVGGGL